MSSETSSLVTRLHSVRNLSNSQRRIADCFLENLHEAAFWGVEDLATRSQSSIATVVRFAQKLGYSGFLELRQALISEAKQRSEPEERFFQAPKDAAETLLEVARRDMANIERTVHAVNEKLLKTAVSLIQKAHHRVAIGRGISSLMGQHLAYLITLAGYPTIAGSPVDPAEQVSNLGPRDLLIGFSFPPYSKETLEVASFARKRHVPILAFTDRLDAPLAHLASETIPIVGENLLYSHSFTAYAVLAHAIATALAHKDAEASVQRLREADQVGRPFVVED